jgi:hypothetical protein
MVLVSVSPRKSHEESIVAEARTKLFRIVAQVYVMEICPNRIRGGLFVFQAV